MTVISKIFQIILQKYRIGKYLSTTKKGASATIFLKFYWIFYPRAADHLKHRLRIGKFFAQKNH